MSMMKNQSEQRRIERIRGLIIQLQQLIDDTTPSGDNEQFLSLLDSLCMEIISYLNHFN